MISIKHYLIICCLLSTSVFAQKYAVFRANEAFLGAMGGMNFSLPNVTDEYRVLTPVAQIGSNTSEKTYDKLFQNRGVNYQLYFMYAFTRKFSVVMQPGFRTMNFHYMTSYLWSDTVNQFQFAREMMHSQRISYLLVPMLARWDFTMHQLSPFIQAGIATDFRLGASKRIRYDEQIDGEVAKETNTTAEASLTEQINRFQLGLVGGGGVTYFTKYFSLGLEANFQYNFSKLVNDQTRFSDQTGFTAQYLDVLDQLHLHSLSIQMHLIFPIDQSVKLNILRKSNYHRKRKTN